MQAVLLWPQGSSIPPMKPTAIASLNTRGCRVSLCRCQVFSYPWARAYAVILLQETHSNVAKKVRWQLEWGDRCTSATVQFLGGMVTVLSRCVQPSATPLGLWRG